MVSREIGCSGTNYEIGLTHGSVAKARIEAAIDNYTRLFEDSVQMSWSDATTYAERFIPALSQKVPHLLEEMQGIADGAKVRLNDIVALNARSEIALTRPAVSSPPDGCTAFSKNSITGDQFLQQNWDWMGSQLPQIVVLKITTPQGRRLTTVTEAGIVAKVGMNDQGVGVTLNALKTVQMDPSLLPIHVALRVVLEAESAQDAIDKLQTLGVSSAAHFLIADPNSSLGVEVNPLRFGILRPDAETGSVFHTNHCVCDDLPKDLTELPWLSDSAPRLSRIEHLVSLIPLDQFGFDTIFEIFKDEDNPPNSVNRQVDPTAKIGICTVFNIIMNCTKKEMRITFGRPTEIHDKVTFNF